jgi:hypothetical protein
VAGECLYCADLGRGQANDQVSRQWARQAAEMFKEELKRGRPGAGEGGGWGGVGAKGGDGAVMLYGNYDRECPFAWRWVQSG